ncbi:hypothetical protein [Isoptericola sp. NPDC060257]
MPGWGWWESLFSAAALICLALGPIVVVESSRELARRRRHRRAARTG